LQRGVIGVTAVSVLGWLWRRSAAETQRETKVDDQSKIRKS